MLASIVGKLLAKAPQIVLGVGEKQGLVVIFSVKHHEYPVVGTNDRYCSDMYRIR